MISNFHVDPSNPIAGQTLVHAYVTVANKGGLTSKPFDITWKPRPNDQKNIGGTLTLAPNQTQNLTSDGYIYPAAGTFNVEVDSDSTEMGSNPTFLSATVNVGSVTSTPPPQTFTFKTPSSGVITHSSCGLTCGQQGDDVLNSGNSPGTGCTITAVVLDLFDSSGTTLQQTVPPGVKADQGNPSHYNAEIMNGTIGYPIVGTTDYTIYVHWGAGPNVSANYRIDYTVQGYSCSQPSGSHQP
jgi:hypothetical protein